MSTRNKQLLGISLLLAIGTLAAFWPVMHCRFVNFDDPEYLDSPQVRAGLTASGISWALTATRAGNWHPLTWMSLMLDRTVYGDNPAGYHVTSLLFHIASVILLFLLLARNTGSLWRSGFVAALFGIHPLHVESVAWIAERKDVLSTFLMMLTLWAYVLYTKRPTLIRRLSSIVLFTLGLMAKPMLVTLPFMLLLLDYWPLGRFKARRKNQPPVGRQLVIEKMPFFILAVASSAITYIAQRAGGAVASLEHLTLGYRVENALLSYVGYMGKMAWPAKLAFFYPYPRHLPSVIAVAGVGALLAVITALVIRNGKDHPYLAVGWLWYVGTLVPVIGLVQVGHQAMADRYTYVPLIGLFIAIAWGASDVALVRRILPALAGIVIVALGMLTWRQAGVWQNSLSLSKHAIAATKDNYEAYCMLGEVYTEGGKPEQAVEQFSAAVRLKPNNALIHTGLANALANEDKLDAAAVEYKKAILLQPNYSAAHYNLGILYARQGTFDEAIEQLSKVAEINRSSAAHPEDFVGSKADAEAIRKLTRDLEADPNDLQGQRRLAIVLARCGRLDEAIAHLSEARRIQGLSGAETVAGYHRLVKARPDDAEAHFLLANALSGVNRRGEAISEYRKAILLKPGLAEAHNNLAVALYFSRRYAEAWEEVRLCRKYGLEPPADFIKALSERQPGP